MGQLSYFLRFHRDNELHFLCFKKPNLFISISQDNNSLFFPPRQGDNLSYDTFIRVDHDIHTLLHSVGLRASKSTI